jgi:hypothetical protein
MWNGYYFNIQDSWTSPLIWAPRWLGANGYGTLTDFIEPPDVRTSTLSGIFTAPSTTTIPPSWLFSAVNASTSGNLLQKFFEVFVNEKEYLFAPLVSLQLTRQMFFDIADPQFAWIVESTDPVNTLTVLASSQITVRRAESDLELFYSGDWRWKQEKNIVLIYGLDIQALVDTVSGYWHFIDSTNLVSSGACFYMEHPHTKNWFPIHPMKVRSDGFTNFYYNGTIRFRGSSARAAKLLEEVTVYVNGKQKLARRIPLYNSVDEKALYFHLSRRYGETNEELGETLLKASWYRGQTYRKCRSYLSAALRTGQLISVAASASSFTLPATATGFAVRNINPWVYVTESLVYPTSGTNSFYTMYASGDLNCGYVRQIKTDFTSVSGVITFNTYVDNSIDIPYIHWKIPYFTQISTGTVTLSENFPHEVPNLVVLLSSKVDVTEASLATLKKSFNRTSPTFKWSRDSLPQEVIFGLADFDF